MCRGVLFLPHDTMLKPNAGTHEADANSLAIYIICYVR